MSKCLLSVVIAAAMSAVVGVSLAQPGDNGGQPRMYGKGQPASIGDLPPGRVRERLESLQPRARQRALDWLQRLEFPAADLDTLQINDGGGVFFVDPMLPPALPDGNPE